MNQFGVFAFHALLPWSIFVILSLVGHYFFWTRPNAYTQRHKIQNVPFKLKDMKRDFLLSSFNLIAVGFVLSLAILTRDSGVTRIHSDPLKYGWGGLLGSLALIMIVHEINFYFFHRLLHHPLFFRAIHGVHHRAHNPSVFSAFAVHPVEMVLVVGFLGPLSFLIPIHWMVLEGFILAIGLHSMATHSNVEFFPRSWSSTPVMKFLTNSTHHNDHHKYVHVNFCYGCLIADRLLGTERKVEPEKSKEDKQRFRPVG